MRVNLFARGREYFDTIILLEELGFVCKENSTTTSAMCLNYDTRMAFRVNQMDDSDRDGVPDGEDCKPFDPAYHGVLSPQVGDVERTLHGYKLDDYYFSHGEWHVKPNAKPVFRKKRLSFMRKQRGDEI